MSQSFDKNLQFSIDETIWLKDGQEAAEILSLALEPDITIEENRNYVSIRGGLVLSGEYKPGDEEASSDVSSPMDEHLQFRTIDEISMSNDGTALIEHTFPVDITIPLNRIDEIEDVYVLVESFDYEIPEPGCLQLYADISISGILEQPKGAEIIIEEEIEEIETTSVFERKENPEEMPTETIRAESFKVEEDAETEKDVSPEIEFNEREEEPVANTPVVEEPVIERSATETAQQERVINEPTVEDPVAEKKVSKAPRQEEPQISKSSSSGEQKGLLQSLITPSPDSKEIKRSEEIEKVEVIKEVELEIEEEEIEVSVEKNHVKSHHDENALYLTKMLANEEDQFAKVKMYIVQQGESLDHISERYQIPVTTLLRNNRLDSDSVKEGQVLYIPILAKK